MKLSTTTAVDILIGMLIAAIATLAGIGTATPTILTDALVALIAGRLGITIPSSATTTPVTTTTTTTPTAALGTPPSTPAA